MSFREPFRGCNCPYRGLPQKLILHPVVTLCVPGVLVSAQMKTTTNCVLQGDLRTEECARAQPASAMFAAVRPRRSLHSTWKKSFNNCRAKHRQFGRYSSRTIQIKLSNPSSWLPKIARQISALTYARCRRMADGNHELKLRNSADTYALSKAERPLIPTSAN